MLGVTGAMGFALTPADAIASVQLTHNVSALFFVGTAESSGPVGRVVSEQAQRRMAYVAANGAQSGEQS